MSENVPEEEKPRSEIYVFTAKDQRGNLNTYCLAETDWEKNNVGHYISIVSNESESKPEYSDEITRQITSAYRVTKIDGKNCSVGIYKLSDDYAEKLAHEI